jgi:hypothetical protein
MTNLKVGAKLYSAVCEGQVLVLHCSGPEADVRCGGVPLATAVVTDKVAVDPRLASGFLIGKRYVDDADQIELLCVKPGKGTLTLNGEALKPKQPKQLPASD